MYTCNVGAYPMYVVIIIFYFLRMEYGEGEKEKNFARAQVTRSGGQETSVILNYHNAFFS